MYMISLYMLAILCCHTIDWDIFLSYWCLSEIYYYYYYYNNYYALLANWIRLSIWSVTFPVRVVPNLASELNPLRSLRDLHYNNNNNNKNLYSYSKYT